MRLDSSPDTLGQALTEDLGPDHRVKALKRLCRNCQHRLGAFGGYDKQIELIRQARVLALWIDNHKAMRNQLVHWQWLRTSDTEMFAFKYTLKGPPQNPKEGTGYITTNPDEVADFAKESASVASQLLELARELRQQLPTWRERSNALVPES